MSFPQSLGSYLLIDMIGAGGLAEVYLGLKQNRAYAVKCLKAEYSDRPQVLANFIREIRIQSKLSHPNIPTVIDQGKSEGTYFVVQELIAGINLEEMVLDYRKLGSTLPLPLTLYIIQECCKTLNYLHSTTVFEHSRSSLFHGDISPKNIMLTQEGYFNLVDFGSAGQNSSYDPSQHHFGKLHYMPPEVLLGRSVSSDTDLYSLAVMCFYLLFGRLPFEADSKLALLDAIKLNPVPRLDATHLLKSKEDATELYLFFNKALHKDPGLRFKNCQEFTQNFERLRFVTKAPKSSSEVASFYAQTTRFKLRQMREVWSKSISAHQGITATKGTTKHVDSLLTHADRRRHPRIATSLQEAKVEVLHPKDKLKLVCPVMELSRGGMLVAWQSLKPEVGQVYLVQLQLSPNTPPIRGFGCLRYEVARSKKTFVGFECRWTQEQDGEVLAAFVEQNLPTNAGERQDKELYLDVYYQSLNEFREEFEKNMRFGGLFIHVPRAYTKDATIILRVQLPDRLGKVLLHGRVVQCVPVDATQTPQQHGVGIELIAKEDELRSLFQL